MGELHARCVNRVKRRGIVAASILFGSLMTTYACGLFPDVSHFLGHESADASSDGNSRDAGHRVEACRFESNAVPLQRAKTRPFSWFGLPVAADGSTIVVAAPLERDAPYAKPPTPIACGALMDSDAVKGAGVVRVYEASGTDWLETQLSLDGIDLANPFVPTEYLPDAVRMGIYQTISLAVSGDWIAVGLAGDANYTGSVRLFHRELGVWKALFEPLQSPNGHTKDLFGVSVALSGDILVVGAVGEDGIGPCSTDCGAAYVYSLGVEGPGYLTKISAPSPQDQGLFGVSVAVSSDHLAVGAPLEGTGTSPPGAVHVYTSHGTPQYTIPADHQGAPLFGASLAIRGDELAVGSPSASPSRVWEGIVRVYSLGLTKPQPVVTLNNPEPKGVFFGASVALSGYGLLVGAPFPSEMSTGDAATGSAGVGPGAAYVFPRDGAGLVSTTPCRLTAPDASPCDVFGTWVAATDEYFVIGAPRNHAAGVSNGDDASRNDDQSGATYVFKPAAP